MAMRSPHVDEKHGERFELKKGLSLGLMRYGCPSETSLMMEQPAGDVFLNPTIRNLMVVIAWPANPERGLCRHHRLRPLGEAQVRDFQPQLLLIGAGRPFEDRGCRSLNLIRTHAVAR